MATDEPVQTKVEAETASAVPDDPAASGGDSVLALSPLLRTLRRARAVLIGSMQFVRHQFRFTKQPFVPSDLIPRFVEQRRAAHELDALVEPPRDVDSEKRVADNLLRNSTAAVAEALAHESELESIRDEYLRELREGAVRQFRVDSAGDRMWRFGAATAYSLWIVLALVVDLFFPAVRLDLSGLATLLWLSTVAAAILMIVLFVRGLRKERPAGRWPILWIDAAVYAVAAAALFTWLIGDPVGFLVFSFELGAASGGGLAFVISMAMTYRSRGQRTGLLESGEERAAIERSLTKILERRERTISLTIADELRLLEDARGVGLDDYSLLIPPINEESWADLSENYLAYVIPRADSTGVGPKPLFEELRSSLATLRRGSIGVAGERGAGKTGLMQALKSELAYRPGRPRDYLDVWISAPTSISEKEFLLSVLAKLAAKLGERITGNAYFPEAPPAVVLARADRRKLSLLAATVIGAILGYAASLWFDPGGRTGLAEIQYHATLTFAAALALPIGLWALLVFGFWILPQRWYMDPDPERGHKQAFEPSTQRRILFACQNLLEALRFEQTVMSSSTMKLGGGGVNVMSGQSKELTRKPFTLPQLVQMWDDFVAQVATSTGGFRKVVIFIDEVDKIKKTEEIGEFMRILKTLYKPLNLFFIVSISEDAYTEFTKRNFSGVERNEFDSSFDIPVWVELLSFQDTLDLVNGRIRGPGLSRPYVQMIWAVSKGNPRDSIRVARGVLSAAELRGDLPTVTAEAIKTYRLEPLEDQSRATLRGLLSPVTFDAFFGHVDQMTGALGSDPDLVEEAMKKIGEVVRSEVLNLVAAKEEERSAMRALQGFAAELFYASTISSTWGAPTQSVDQFKKIDRDRLLTRLRGYHQQQRKGESVSACNHLTQFRENIGLSALPSLTD